jgi:hypothetical protein
VIRICCVCLAFDALDFAPVIFIVIRKINITFNGCINERDVHTIRARQGVAEYTGAASDERLIRIRRCGASDSRTRIS